MKNIAVVLTIAVCGLVALAVSVVRPNGAGSGSAHAFPQGCASAGLFPVPILDAPGSIPPVTDGSVLRFRARVSLPPLTIPEDPVEVLCALSDVDVFIRLPGDRRFQHVCRLELLNEGEVRVCPDSVVYEVDPLDVTDGRLRAQIRIIANVHDGDSDCSTPRRKRDPMRVSDCIDATAITLLRVVPSSP